MSILVKPLVSVAPMVDRTDRHFRFFIRQLAPRSLLYTEMHTTGAVIHGPREMILGFDPREKPLSLQLAGDDPDDLARAVEIASAYDYDEINLNCGCPSDKVQEAHFGACLMAEPELVAQLVKAMKAATDKPVTVKHRIGIDHLDSYEHMAGFVEKVASAGAERLTVHARIAILQGLDPKQNREIPPLRYTDVYRLKKQFPNLVIEINGGIKTLEDVALHLEHVDSVMLGRIAYDEPYFMTQVERLLYGDPLSEITRRAVLEKMMVYLDEWQERALPPHKIFRHMTGLFAGLPGARKWRRLLSPPYRKRERASDLFREAIEALPSWVLDLTEAAASGPDGPHSGEKEIS